MHFITGNGTEVLQEEKSIGEAPASRNGRMKFKVRFIYGFIPPKRIESVWMGKDNGLLDVMLDYYAPTATRIIDVCCNARRMWKGTQWGKKVLYYDIDPEVQPDQTVNWGALPDQNNSVDVLIYDPPHLPAHAGRNGKYMNGYGLLHSTEKENIADLHESFLQEAKRVLKPNGLIFAKIKDYINNRKYQWNLEYFKQEVRKVGLIPCDLIIKKDPSGGKMLSSKWKHAYHAKNVHCYWVIVRKGRCTPR